MDIGTTIKKARRSKGIKLRQLSEGTGLSKPYLSQIENSERIPKVATLEKIATYLNIPLWLLFYKPIKLDLEIELDKNKKEELVDGLNEIVSELSHYFNIGGEKSKKQSSSDVLSSNM